MKLLIALTALTFCCAVAASSPKLQFKDQNGLCTMSKSGTSVTSDCDVSAPGASIVGNKALIDGIDTKLAALDTRLAALETSVITVVTTLTAHMDAAATDAELATAIANVQLLKGDKGDAGAKGETGQKGEAGVNGTKGEVGADGTKGEVGARGLRGHKGDQGNKGDQGEKGHTGWGGICHNGSLIALAQRTGVDHCGSCNNGYKLESTGGTVTGTTSAPYCRAYAGSCSNGDLITPQSARRQDNHCGSCNDGYYLSLRSCLQTPCASSGGCTNCNCYVGANNGKWNLGPSSWSRAYFPKRTGNWVEVTNTAEIATAGNCGQMLNLGANSGTVVIGKNAVLEVVG